MAYNSLHTALEAAVNTLLAAGLCGEINLTMSPNFSVEGNNITGANFKVECTRELNLVNTPMSITFQQPTQREDGSVLMCVDITGYVLVFDGKSVTGHTVTADGKSKPATSCVGER